MHGSRKNNSLDALQLFFDEYSNMHTRTGIFGRRIPMKCSENSKSGSLAAHLQNYLPHFEGINFMWYHQFEDPSGD
jgi:hypothetical protein